MDDEARRRRGRAVYASQLRVPEHRAEEALAEIVGPGMAADAVLAAGGAWEDDILTLRERSLVVVAALAAQGGVEARLAAHARWALDHGATPAELEELLRLLAIYVGYPRASVAMEVVRREVAAWQPPPGPAR